MINQPLYKVLSKFERTPIFRTFAVLREESGPKTPLILPEHLALLGKFGVDCIVEDGPYRDDYAKSGALIFSRSEITKKAEVILQVRCYFRGLEFYREFQNGNLKILYTTPHFEMFDFKSKVTEILPKMAEIRDLTEFKDPDGNRTFEVFEESGMIGAELLVPYLNPGSKIALLGYNRLGRGALKTLCRAGFDVQVFRRDCYEELQRTLGQWDAVINAINWPLENRGKKYLISRSDLSRLKPSAILLDLDVDEEGMGPFETCKVVEPDDPEAQTGYFVDGIRHISVWGYPALNQDLCIKKYSESLMNILMRNYGEGGLFYGD